MSSLIPHLPLDPRESSVGYLRRLAIFHIGEEGKHLLRHMEIPAPDFARGEAAAVVKLAERAGVDVASLMSQSILRTSRYREFRGERWSRDFVVPEGVRFCPVCLLEGGTAPWEQVGHLGWRLRPVRVCCVHGCDLVARPVERIDRDFGQPFPKPAMLEEFAASVRQSSPNDFDSWLMARINASSQCEGDFLGGQTLEQGAKLCEMLGATLEFGLKAKISKLSGHDLALAAERGFTIAKQGEPAVMAALDEVRAMSGSTAGQAGPKAMYGHLYEWVRNSGGDTGPGPIRDLLREHILRTTAIERGEVVLGEEVTERRMHSAYSLSLATGLHPKRLRKILVRQGLVPRGCDDLDYNLLVFPVGETEELCRDIVTSVSLHRVPEYLGCSRTQAESLYRTGAIKPIVDKDREEGINMISFSLSELEQFRTHLEQLPVSEVGDLIDLSKAAKISGRTTGDLMDLIFAGQLSASRRSGAIGLGSVLVARGDLARWRPLVPG